MRSLTGRRADISKGFKRLLALPGLLDASRYRERYEAVFLGVYDHLITLCGCRTMRISRGCTGLREIVNSTAAMESMKGITSRGN